MRRYMHLKWTILMVVLEGGFPGSYSQDWAITLPESIRALRGSCVEIPCTFTRPRGNKDFSLVWYNEDSFPDKIIFSQQDPSDVSEGYRHRTSLVGNEPNSCSLRINGVQESETYYPYINGNCNIFSDICQTVRVQVSDDPNVPVIKMPSILTEGKRAFISCSVEHTCPPRPPTLQWNRAGYKLTDRQQSLKDGVWKAETVMEYLPSYRDHGAELECEATYPNGLRSQRRVTLNIRYSPKNTVIIISDGKKERKEGDAVSLICASDANPAANAFTWYNNKRDGTVELREEQGRSITVTVGRGRETFSCTARNPLGTGNSTLSELQVFYSPKNVRVISDGKKERKEGDAVSLTCASDANPAANAFTWYNNKRDGTVELREEQGRSITVTVGRGRETFSCTARNPLGTGNSSVLDLQVLSTQTGEEPPIGIILGGGAGAVLVILLALGLYLFLRKSHKVEASGDRRVETNIQLNENIYIVQEKRDTAIYENSQPLESPYAALQRRDTDVYEVLKLQQKRSQ